MSFDDSSAEPRLLRLESHLRQQRYNEGVIERYLWVGRRFLIYLLKRRIDVRATLPSHVSAYLKAELGLYRKRHQKAPKSQRQWRGLFTGAVRLLLRLEQGRWPPVPPAVDPLDIFHRQVCEDYARWLIDVCGLAPSTIADRCAAGRRFLSWLGESGSQDLLRRLSVTDIDAYLANRSQQLGRAARNALATNLRSFLHHLYRQGRIACDLGSVVTGPTLYALESLPSAIGEQDIITVIKTTRRDRTPKGLRDFAILQLLAHYGLRAGEMAGLCLKDIDWRHQRLRIRPSKTGAVSMLPLLVPVGSAIVDYLRHGRPQTQARQVFIRAHAPYHPFHDGSSLHSLITHRLESAGVQTQGKHGPHVFRHAQAVRLLRQKVPLKTIGDILGHRDPTSTAIYLKLATADLRAVGLEVPQEVAP